MIFQRLPDIKVPTQVKTQVNMSSTTVNNQPVHISKNIKNKLRFYK